MSRGRPAAAREAAPVTRAQLGSSLRACVEAARGLGAEHRWRPSRGSPSARDWSRAARDPLCRTVCEADVHAITLLHSGLEHASAVGQLLSASRVFLPHTVARTATEHLLRAQHLIDPGVDDQERARRRSNEWLYAIGESDHRRQGFEAHVAALGAEMPQDLGRDKDDLVAEVVERAQAIGESIVASGKSPRVQGSSGRPSTMRLAEEYTAGGATGIPSFTLRGYSAFVHGTEIGLLSGFADDAPADLSLGGVVVPQPAPVDVPTTAFALLSVLLCTLNSIDAARTRWSWAPDARMDRRFENAKRGAIDTWATAANAG